jgi:hypothetical protein
MDGFVRNSVATRRDISLGAPPPLVEVLPSGSSAVDVRFVTQPFEDGTDLRDFLHAVAGDRRLSTLRIVVAWAKRSGLGRAARDLRVVKDRGGSVQAIVGVSEGGATEQGLQALIELADEAHVFHDSGRTFHPKVYLAYGTDHALLLVGSHNLTAGGMAWNYEAGLWCALDLDVDADRKVHDDVVAYFDRLRADTAVCIMLDSPTLRAMLADGSLLIQDEDAESQPKVSDPDRPEDTDSTGIEGDQPSPQVFGKSQIKMRKVPLLAPKPPKKAPPPEPVPVTGSVPGSRPAITIMKRWFKRMDGTAAQHPPGARSHPTGNLRLSQEDFSIDHTTYFRRVFFGGLDWRPATHVATMEELWVIMETTIAGDYLGSVNLRISHLPSRISNQGNVPTVLHWGDLGSRMRQNNYVGLYVILERGMGDEFGLTISSQPTGPFQY